MVDPIARGPVLAHPESLDLPACREALREANAQLLAQAEHIKVVTGVLNSMASDMARLLLAHQLKDAVAVKHLLDEITAQSVCFLGPDGQPVDPATADPSTIH